MIASALSSWLCIELGSDDCLTWKDNTVDRFKCSLVSLTCPVVVCSSSSLTSSNDPKSEHSDGAQLLRLDRDELSSFTEPLRESILSLSRVSCWRNAARFSLICINCSSTTSTSSELLILLVRSELRLADEGLLLNDALFRLLLFLDWILRSWISPQDEFLLMSEPLGCLFATTTLNEWSISLQ